MPYTRGSWIGPCARNVLVLGKRRAAFGLLPPWPAGGAAGWCTGADRRRTAAHAAGGTAGARQRGCRHRPAYMIGATAQTLDVLRFGALTSHGRAALAEGRAEAAANVLREGLELWRGPALADVGERLRSEVVPRLNEQRLSALEARVDADLALGRHAELVGELRTLVAAHPLHERVHGQLMRALQRSGRRAEALDAYRTMRQVLVAELGVEPAADLQQLHLELLGRDRAIPALPTNHE